MVVGGLLLVGLLTPTSALAQPGDTGHVVGNVPESLVFQFTTPSTVNVGALPIGASADASFGFLVSANGNWNLTATPQAPAGLSTSYQKEGQPTYTPMTNGTPLALRSGTATAGVGWTDVVRVTNDSAGAGAFDVSVAWLVSLA
jgi:hypothetical protein